MFLIFEKRATGNVLPNAKIPTELFPAAVPCLEATLAAAPEELTQPENVYLSLVVEEPETHPRAKIANVPVKYPVQF